MNEALHSENKLHEILIVDDFEANLRLLSDLLIYANYKTLLASSGTQALEILANHAPSMILLDIMMPEMDGFALCKLIKEDSRISHIPIIFISALNDHESKIKGFTQGGVDYITKPFRKEEVLARIKTQLRLFELQEQLTIKNKELEETIEKQQITQKLLTESEERNNAFINASLDLTFVKDENQRYLMANDAIAKFFGKTKEEILGKTDSELAEEGIILPCKSSDTKAYLATEPFTIEEKLGTRIFETTKFPIHIKDGKIRIGGIMHDITQRKKNEKLISEEKQLLRTLIDNLPVTIYVKDIKARKVIANKTDVEVMGKHSESDVLGKTDLEIFQNEIGERGYNDDMNVIQKLEPVMNREESFLDPDGAARWLLTSKIPLLDQHGKVKGLVGIGRDITEQKQAAETIKHERKLLRTLIDNLPFAIYIKDKKGRKLVANAADLKLMNCQTEAEIIGKTDEEIFYNDPDKGGYKEDLEVLNTGNPLIDKENKYLDTDGTEHWRVISKFPLRDENNQITGLFGIGRDITEQKKANATIQKLTLSIEQSPSVVIITDTKGVIEYVNPSFTSVTGYNAEEALGSTTKIIKSGHTPMSTYQNLWETITQGNVWRGEMLNRKKNGDTYWEWSIITSLKNDKGEITNYIAIKDDITWRKQLENDLITAKNKAEENDRLKSAFLANMSHEIRTPLNSILGFAELLADPDMQEDIEQRMEFAKLIMSSGNNLLHIINDIVDISKIEAGQVELHLAPFEAQKIIAEVWNENRYRAQDKGLELIISDQLPQEAILLESDASKLKQVLINFVGNSLKFTEKGSIELGINKDPDYTTFYVKDTGIGIPSEAHDRIFERFRQIEGSATRKYGGNGLGLAISKSLIEMLGGSIGMNSELGKGSTFYFNIPIKLK